MKFIAYIASLAMIFTSLSFANESALVTAAKNSDLAKVKAAIAAGQRMEAAMARRIFPESTTAGWGATALLP